MSNNTSKSSMKNNEINLNKNLVEVREEIEKIDAKIVKLLITRLTLSLQAKKWKEQAYDPGREKEVLDKVEAHGLASGYHEILQRIFMAIIQECRELQLK